MDIRKYFKRRKRSALKIEEKNLMRICPGQRHAWFKTVLGPIRKPIILVSK